MVALDTDATKNSGAEPASNRLAHPNCASGTPILGHLYLASRRPILCIQSWIYWNAKFSSGNCRSICAMRDQCRKNSVRERRSRARDAGRSSHSRRPTHAGAGATATLANLAVLGPVNGFSPDSLSPMRRAN